MYCYIGQPLKAVSSGIADKPFGLVDLFHYLIAGVYTCCTADALELEPVPYVYSGRADGGALIAVNTVSFLLPLFSRPPPGLSPYRVIG